MKAEDAAIPERDRPPLGYFDGREHRFPIRVFYEDTDFSGVAFVIRKINLDYRSSARIDDVLSVVTSYDTFKGARLLVSQRIERGGEVILTADSEAACIDLTGRPRRAPKEMIDKLRPYLL